MTRIDRLTEGASRWMASRTSRRSFLATTGKAAVVVTGGATMATLFASRAEARACGQSGVSPRCSTYDCVGPDVVWGWCWYASPGCCTNGGLKKICDCCKRDHPNVHGYCPEGHNVYCMVESCLEDPRLQKVSLERTYATDAVEVSLARLATRAAASTPSLVLAAADPLASAIAGPLATRLGLPLVLTDPGSLRPGLVSELGRVGVTRVRVVGIGIAETLLSALRTVVTDVEVIGSATYVAVASVEIGVRIAEGRPALDTVCIGADRVSLDIAASAASFAAARNLPVLIGIDALNAFRGQTGTTGANFLVGDGVADEGARVAEPVALRGRDARALSLALADRLFDATAAPDAATKPVTFGLAFVPQSSTAIGAGYTPVGGPLIVHDDGQITPALRDWLIARRARFAVAECVFGVAGSLPDSGIIELQGALNGYDRQFLRGDDDGVGLPVFAQPLEERPIGMVRVTGPLPSTSVPGNIPRARHKRPIGVAAPNTAVPRLAPGAPTSAPPTTVAPSAAPSKGGTPSTKAGQK
jgi:hypothetical protein